MNYYLLYFKFIFVKLNSFHPKSTFFSFHLIMHHLEIPGVSSFPNRSFIFLLCLCHYVYVNMLPKQPLHSVNSVKKEISQVCC